MSACKSVFPWFSLRISVKYLLQIQATPNVEFCNHWEIRAGRVSPDTFLWIRRCKVLVDNSIHRDAFVMCLSVVRSSKYVQSNKWSFNITCKSEWMSEHPLTWRRAANGTSSVNIDHKNCIHGRWNFIRHLTISKYEKTVADASDLIVCSIFDKHGRFWMTMRAANHGNWLRVAMFLCNYWLEGSSGLCQLWVILISWWRGTYSHDFSVLG